MAYTENIKDRQPYRVCTDAENRVYDKIMLLTNGNSVDCEDGMTVEEKIGDFKGIVTDTQFQEGYVLDSTIAGKAPTILSATLRTGDTSVSFTNPKITSTAFIQFFTSMYGLSPKEVTQSGNTLTVLFAPQEIDVNVRVMILNV